MQAGQRPGKTGNLIGDHPMAEGGVALGILVGVDQQFIDLWRQALGDPGRHRPAMQDLQSLVDATHAPAKAAGQHDTGNARAVHQ